MKKPSRFMPKLRKEPIGPLGWILFFGIALLICRFAWSFPFILFIVPVLALLELIDRRERKAHFAKLLNERRNDSICSFVRHFEYRKIDTWVIRAVYEQLQNYLVGESPEFSVRATDDIFVDLKIDNEDFGFDIVEEIAQRTGRTLKNIEHNPYYGKANIVENIVYLFNGQPKEIIV